MPEHALAMGDVAVGEGAPGRRMVFVIRGNGAILEQRQRLEPGGPLSPVGGHLNNGWPCCRSGPAASGRGIPARRVDRERQAVNARVVHVHHDSTNR